MSKILVKPDNSATVHVDYYGNIYLKYNDNYYIVSLDPYSEHGIELCLIKSIESFRQNYTDYQDTLDKTKIKSGTIRLTSNTLKGHVSETLSGKPEEEREYNDGIEMYIEEKKKYWIQNLDEEDDEDDDYYLNGIGEGILYADILYPFTGSFNTILIDGNDTSNNIVSTIEKKDGTMSMTLTIYSKVGVLKANFLDKKKYASLIHDGDTLKLVRHVPDVL